MLYWEIEVGKCMKPNVVLEVTFSRACAKAVETVTVNISSVHMHMLNNLPNKYSGRQHLQLTRE